MRCLRFFVSFTRFCCPLAIHYHFRVQLWTIKKKSPLRVFLCVHEKEKLQKITLNEKKKREITITSTISPEVVSNHLRFCLHLLPSPNKSKLVSVLLTLIASAIDVAPASPIPLPNKNTLVSVLLTLIASATDIAPASLI